MKKSKFMNLLGIVFLTMLVVIISSCKEKKTADADADTGKVVDSLLAIPEGLIEISDTTAEVFITAYHDSTTERNFGQGLPYEVGKYLLKKYKTDIILSLAKKDTNIFSIYVIPIDSSGTISYKFFTDGKNVDATYSMLYQQIPVCKPGNCPCRYYPPPCN